MDKSYQNFLESLAARESGGNYQAINSYGYLGKYQMGEAALIDSGYYTKDGTANNDWRGQWTGKDGISSSIDFLKNTDAQETAIRDYMSIQWKYIEHFKLDEYVGKELNGITITESGLLAGAHLKQYLTPTRPAKFIEPRNQGALAFDLDTYFWLLDMAKIQDDRHNKVI